LGPSRIYPNLKFKIGKHLEKDSPQIEGLKMEHKHMKTAGYVRVSTPKQVKDGEHQ
jgi:hypothetical protein